MSFSIINLAISLVAGWFVMSFLHAAVASAVTKEKPSLRERFLAIALFKDRRGAVINLVLIAVIGGIATALWFLFQPRG